MARRLILKEGGLTGSVSPGFRGLGLDSSGTLSILSGATSSTVGGGGSGTSGTSGSNGPVGATGSAGTSGTSGTSPAGGGLSQIPQTDIIYVDSVTGTDDTSSGRGNIELPYATVEYALSNTTNTATITGDTTNGSATLTNVSSTTNIKVGQYITGTNIPYNSVVVSKTANTIVLSQTATGTGTGLTLTWWTPKTIKIMGDVIATSNWFKAGFWFDCGDSNITWGNFALFSITTTQVIPFNIYGGNWYGNNASSKWFNITSSSAVDFTTNINYFSSIGTAYQIDCNPSGPDKFRNWNLTCTSFSALFGQIADFESSGKIYASGIFYGLLGGIRVRYARFYLYGEITTPVSVNALTRTTSGRSYIYANVTGQAISFEGVISGDLTGTNNTFGSATINGKVLGNISTGGEFVINGVLTGNITASSFALVKVAAIQSIDSTSTYSITTSGQSKIIVGGGGVGTWFNSIGSITLAGTSYAIVYDGWFGQAFNNGSPANISVASGCTLELNGINWGTITSLAGTIINNGKFNHVYKSADITGTFINNSELFLTRVSFIGESSTNTPTLCVSTGTIILNGGSVYCDKADSKSGLIRKTADGGKLILKNQPYLRVANGLAPLQILSNTGTAQDVMDFSMIGNGASGYRLADTFSDTTYGTAYAPNLLVNGTRYEDSSYSF